MITISDTNEKLLKDFFPNSKLVRIYNPTSIKSKNQRVECENNDYYIYVGRIDKEKGINYLCESFKNSNDKLVLVGSGTEYQSLKGEYESEKIKFTGWIKHDEVISYIKHANALVFPCLLYEGAPLTIFEAQSQGLPCIVSKYSNASDFVDEENGWIYDPYDDSLYNILKNISIDDIKKKSLISYELYWKNPYDKKRYINKMIKLLDEI